MGGNIPCVGGSILLGGTLGCLDLTGVFPLVFDARKYQVPGSCGLSAVVTFE